MNASDLPTTADNYPCYASLHRTLAWPESDRELRDLQTLEATKIGGYPKFLQVAPPRLLKPGHLFLGTLGAVQPRPDAPYPWLNQKRPIPLRKLWDLSTFMVGDAGNLNLFLEGDEVIWDAASY